MFCILAPSINYKDNINAIDWNTIINVDINNLRNRVSGVIKAVSDKHAPIKVESHG